MKNQINKVASTVSIIWGTLRSYVNQQIMIWLVERKYDEVYWPVPHRQNTTNSDRETNRQTDTAKTK